MKLIVTIRSGSLGGKNFQLTDGFLTIGRGTECQIMFDPTRERAVSTKHAYIETRPDGFYLVDNKSTNGTYLNGQRVEQARLNNRDAVQFGKNGPEATIEIEDSAEARQPNFANQFQPPNQPNQAAQFQTPQFQPPPPAANFRNSITGIGLQNPAMKPLQNPTRKYVGAAIAIVAIVFLGLVVSLIILGELGIVPAVIAAFVAFVPATIYILPLIFLDRYDPEPPWALALAFAWGALAAITFSFIINSVLGAVFGQSIAGVVSAPIFEEGSKGLGVVLFLVFLRREFDDVLDGIVYAGTIALGFATVENVLYYGRGLLGGALIITFIMRGIMSPFAHVTFTSMTGIGCGISRETHNRAIKFLAPLLGYFCAVALHAVWNGMAFFGGPGGLVIGYFVLEVPFFLIFVGFALYVMHRQNKILKEMLAIDVARGLISPEQLKISTSVFKSTGWLLGGLTSGKLKARRRFLRAVGKLGLSYWHIQRATAAHGQTGSFQQNPILREEVLEWRDKV